MKAFLAEPVFSRELLRPWKLLTLLAGITLLIIGAYIFPAPDWDIPISFIMALCTYVFAPWTVRVVARRRLKLAPLALLATWFCVDGCYALYWSFRNAEALAAMRSANFPASLCLYAICGVLWMHEGGLREMFQGVVRKKPDSEVLPRKAL